VKGRLEYAKGLEGTQKKATLKPRARKKERLFEGGWRRKRTAEGANEAEKDHRGPGANSSNRQDCGNYQSSYIIQVPPIRENLTEIYYPKGNLFECRQNLKARQGNYDKSGREKKLGKNSSIS